MIAIFIRSGSMAEAHDETPNATIEAEWFQLTYNELRTAPDGEFVAHFDAADDAWYFKGVPYSDIVMETSRSDPS